MEQQKPTYGEDNDNNDASIDDYDDEEDEDDHFESSVPSSGIGSRPGIKTPAFSDIICGRGKSTSQHPGNRHFRGLIAEKKPEYQRATRRDDKTRITTELVQTIRDRGSKFLLFDSKVGLWYDVGDYYAKEKVSHSLRSRPAEQKRSKPKSSKKFGTKKSQHSPALEKVVSSILQDQQALLERMIRNSNESMHRFHGSSAHGNIADT